MRPHLRIARPVTDIESAARMYCDGLTLRILASFRDHDGFDGIMLGSTQSDYHLEFTRSRRHPLVPCPTPEDLLVFYHPSRPDWKAACDRMNASGFREIRASNPYWNVRARSYMDPDGYRIVLERAAWPAEPHSARGRNDHDAE